ncbi:MAG: class I SAM-dependent methyltransferase [Anaerolineae bacterium]
MAAREHSVVLPEDKHWWFNSRTLALQSVLDPLVHRRGLVLDVGGGAGNMVHHLSRYGAVIGLDNAWKPLRVAWERGYSAVPGVATAMPFRPGSFSMVAMLDVIEHCQDDVQVLAEAYRVCEPGGLVVITTPAFPWLWSHNDVANHHARRYTRSHLRNLLTSVGFDVARISYTYFLVFPAAAGLVLLRKAMGAKSDISTPADGDAYQVEMEPAPGALNAVLGTLGKAEAALLRRTDLFPGTALLAVASKP